jgi:hypothetical protein
MPEIRDFQAKNAVFMKNPACRLTRSPVADYFDRFGLFL